MGWQMRWLGTACFEIALPNGTTLVIDPYLDDSVSAPIPSDRIEACDFIFLTHGHYDHVLDVGKLWGRHGAKIFCSPVTARSLAEHQGVDPAAIRTVRPGDLVEEEGLRAEILPGVHVDFAAEYQRLTGLPLPVGARDLMSVIRAALKDLFHTDWLPERFAEWMGQYPGGEQLNFVFELPGGKRIYMAGSYPDPKVIQPARSARLEAPGPT